MTTLTESWSRKTAAAEDKRIIVTTSWDDGHVLDRRLAGLLDRYGLKGTFYVSPASRELDPAERLSAEQIAELARGHEIGAHTWSHPDLTRIPLDEAVAEIEQGRKFIEDITGQPVTSFCYPYGHHNRQLARALRRLGFAYARTVSQYETGGADPRSPGYDPLAAGTTVHAYPHHSGLIKKLRLAGYNPFKAARYRDWGRLAADAFDRCLAEGGVFHLWGHSWEIDRHGDWDRLAKVFAHISGRDEAGYATNGALGRPPQTRLVIAAAYFPPKMGGLEVYAARMASGAAAAGYDVHVITSGTAAAAETERTGDGVTIHRLPVQFRISDTPVSLRWIRQVRKLMRTLDPDIVNVHLPVPYLADLVAFLSPGAPVVVTYHSGSMKGRGFVLDRIIDAYEKGILPLALRRTGRIICSSDFIRDGFLRKYRGKSTVINPGVDAAVFSRRSTVPQNRKVLFVGDFRTGLKGLDYLKEAIKLVPDATLHVVGQGPRIASLGTIYHGPLSETELAGQIRDSQVLVLPSINESEGFGMVLIEAMACGVPVIGTRVGGVPSLISDGEDGLLVPPGDAGALAAAIGRILDHPDLACRLADKAFIKVSKSYLWEASVERYLHEIASVVPAGAGGSACSPQVSRS